MTAVLKPPTVQASRQLLQVAPIDATSALAVDGDHTVGIIDAQGAWTPVPVTLPAPVRQVTAVSTDAWWAALTDGSLWAVIGAQADQIGTGISVDVGVDRCLWALDASGAAKELVTDVWETRSTAPALQSLTVGCATLVAGLDAAGKPWCWSPSDTDWVECAEGAPGPFVCLAMDDSEALFGVDAAGSLWAWMGSWVPSGGEQLVSVAVAGDGSVWLLDSKGDIVVFPGQAGDSEHPVPQVLPQWDAESVFDDTQSTHLWIVNRAARLVGSQGGDLGNQICSLVEPDVHKADQPFHNGLCQGLYDADFKAQYNNWVWPQATYKSHFYDPDTGKNWRGEREPTALTQATHFFHQAVRVARAQGDRVSASYDAGYALGLALHYFTDITQPMHACNFTAVDWPLLFHGAFETWMMANQAQLPVTDIYPAPASTDPGTLLIATARRSKAHFRADVWPAAQRDRVLPYYTSWDFRKLSRNAMGTVLTEAVTATAQFLIAWVTDLKQPRTAVPGPLVTMGNPQQVAFLGDTEGDLYAFRYQNGWTLADLTRNPAFPHPCDNPVTPLAGWSGTRYSYRSADGHIQQLWPGNGLECADLTALAGAPLCREDSAFAALNSPQLQLFYTAVDGHVHQLLWQSRWIDTDLAASNGAPACAPGSAIAVSAAGPRVYYQSSDGHVHCLYWQSSSWMHLDLTAVPGMPTPHAETALVAQSSAVLIVAADGHLWACDGAGSKAVDLTAAGNAPAARPDTPLATLTAPTSQVFYVAATGHLTQLWRYQSGWKCTDLTALTNSPAPDPASSLVTLSVPQPQQVFYVGPDNHVHQLWYQDHWRHTDLSSV